VTEDGPFRPNEHENNVFNNSCEVRKVKWLLVRSAAAATLTRLRDPRYAAAFCNRDLDAIRDYIFYHTVAIKLEPGDAAAFYDRGIALQAKGDLDSANAIAAFNNRGHAWPFETGPTRSKDRSSCGFGIQGVKLTYHHMDSGIFIHNISTTSGPCCCCC